MKIKLGLLFFSFLFSATLQAQNSLEKILVGRWDTADSQGDSVAIYLQSDKTMYMASKGIEIGRGEMPRKDGSKVKVLMKYAVDPSTTPAKVDFIIFVNDYNNPVARQEGILEVLDNNTIRMVMSTQNPPVRPIDFRSMIETRIYFRHGTVNNVGDCTNVKDGKFRVDNTPLGNMYIERKGDHQIQTFDSGFKNKIKVTWTGACTYDLTPLENYVNNKWQKDTTNTVMHVRIIHVRKNSFFYISTYSNAPLHITGEMIAVKD